MTRLVATVAVCAALAAVGCSEDAETGAPTASGGGAGAAGATGAAGPGGAGAGGGVGGGAGCESQLSPEPGLVITEYGAVRGQLAGNTYLYKGIPYAAPPLGPLRFRPPVAPACIDGELDATAFGNMCVQRANGGGVEGDEDCLTLNVWAPAQASSPRTVMLFIHGGGNVNGSSSSGGDADPLFNGQPYVEQADIVFVSINYRLGALGYLAHPTLTAEDPNGSSGNYGLLDQIAALTWVRDNIAHFGGDPQRVMIFGESAGAIDSCALLASPLAAGLIHRVLMESGACVSQPLAVRETDGDALAASLGCTGADVPACMRMQTTADIVAAQPPVGSLANPLGLRALKFGPTVDGHVLLKDPLQALSDGEHNDVPFVAGSNADESTVFVQPIVTQNAYQQIVYDHYGQTNGDLVLQMYTPQMYGNARRALIALSTDASFTCPTRAAVRAAAASQSSAVYRYYFTHVLEGGATWQALGAFHALELFFVFQRPNVTSYMLNPAEIVLSQDMLGYWSRFAITGDPNGSGAIAWPSYAPGNDHHLVLDTTIVAADGIRTAQCDLLDSF